MLRWLYSTSLIVVMAFFAGFCAVIPIDAISQASTAKSNYALNTFVVVGALVLFGIVAAFITSARIYSKKMALQDIPKRYVPLDEGDLPRSCLKMINENFDRCEKIRQKAMFVSESIKHPGLSSPNSTLLPPLLPFDDVVKTVGMKFKWSQELNDTEITIPKSLSFREIIAFLEDKIGRETPEKSRELVELYEELRYSGKLITEDKFIAFMEFSVELLKNTRMAIEVEEFRANNGNNSQGRSGSFLYPSSEISRSRSTFDALSSYSIRDRSGSNIKGVDTDYSQGVSDQLYDNADETSESDDGVLYRPPTWGSISSTATTNRYHV